MQITDELLLDFLNDRLSATDLAQLEQLLRQDQTLQHRLQLLQVDVDRGDHSLGSIWQNNRLSCPTRDQLAGYLLQALDPEYHDYINFHLETIRCLFCQANLEDLVSMQKDAEGSARVRRQRIFQSSIGMIRSKQS